MSRKTTLRSPDLHVIRADVLRDAAGFALGDARLADRVEQRRLAVVDVAHDGDDRRARHEVLGLALADSTSTISSSNVRICTSAPNSRATAVAVSLSSVELMVIIFPCSSSFFRTSLTRASSLSARSLTVMPSASVMALVMGGGARRRRGRRRSAGRRGFDASRRTALRAPAGGSRRAVRP